LHDVDVDASFPRPKWRSSEALDRTLRVFGSSDAMLKAA
jgi:hypothetical protein